MDRISEKHKQFTYFDQILDHPRWRELRVLDFGGNVGNILLDPGSTIRPENYTCIDVIPQAVQEGARRFPGARWLHYNRHNPAFNPGGVFGLPIPDLGARFEIILAYSVFTHTLHGDMRELVGQLRRRLAPGGVLAFTFIDPHFESWPGRYHGGNLRWRLERGRQTDPGAAVEALLEQGRGAHWCTLVDDRTLYVNDDSLSAHALRHSRTFHTYFTVRCISRRYPGALIHPPANGEMQHCGVLSAGEAGLTHSVPAA